MRSGALDAVPTPSGEETCSGKPQDQARSRAHSAQIQSREEPGHRELPQDPPNPSSREAACFLPPRALRRLVPGPRAHVPSLRTQRPHDYWVPTYSAEGVRGLYLPIFRKNQSNGGGRGIHLTSHRAHLPAQHTPEAKSHGRFAESIFHREPGSSGEAAQVPRWGRSPGQEHHKRGGARRKGKGDGKVPGEGWVRHQHRLISWLLLDNCPIHERSTGTPLRSPGPGTPHQARSDGPVSPVVR